jgi:hypothetical protein
MHVADAVFDMEERRIERAQAVAGHVGDRNTGWAVVLEPVEHFGSRGAGPERNEPEPAESSVG